MNSQRIIFCFIALVFVCNYSKGQKINILKEDLIELGEIPYECISVEYPNKLNQVLTDSTFLDSPQNLHPVFYGCFDWHSSVHGHWLLANLLKQIPAGEFTKKIETLFDTQFTSEKIEKELAYFEPKLEKSFERTYGWAWILKLQAELLTLPQNETHGWSKKLKPLADFIAESYKTFLPKLVYPIRNGEHTNTAYGLSLAFDYAVQTADTAFSNLIIQRSKDYYQKDCNCDLAYEPSGFDFISPCLQEAELMSKVLTESDFTSWMKKFMPEIFKKNFQLVPAIVLDRTDGKLVHLDGLNFSRAQCLYAIGKKLPKQKVAIFKLADEHINASLNYVIGSDYMGSHWLATFLVRALNESI